MKILRPLFQALLATVLASALLAPVAAAQYSAPGDSGWTGPPVPGPWPPQYLVLPPSPCVMDSIVVQVMGYEATPCDSFMGAEVIGPSHIRVRNQVYANRRCFAAPSKFYPILLNMGHFQGGLHAFAIEQQTYVLTEPSVTPSITTSKFELPFYVSASCSLDTVWPPPPPPPPPPSSLPYVSRIYTDPSAPCSGRPVSLVVEGYFTDGCGELLEASLGDSGGARLVLDLNPNQDGACPAVMKSWRAQFPLERMLSGTYAIRISERILHDAQHPGVYSDFFSFKVSNDCDSVPPPPGILPYVDGIVIGQPRPCARVGSNQVCPGDSITVQVFGAFPSNCFSLIRTLLLPNPSAQPGIQPPILRLEVETQPCSRRACVEGPVPWSTSVNLPPLPGRAYTLMVELAEYSCARSDSVWPPSRALVPFAVLDSCPFQTPSACVQGLWRPRVADDVRPDPGVCDARVSASRPAVLTLALRSSVALSGLQGDLRLSPPGLKITRLDPVGPAAGMHLTWQATADGAKYVLFSEHGAPIPAGVPESPPPAVLRVTVGTPPGTVPPRTSWLSSENLLGADSLGGGVPGCVPPPCQIPVGYLYPREAGPAVICAEDPCDFNEDGIADIRDLVQMVHCVNGEGPCPDSASSRFDCDLNHRFDIDDVLCCAVHILSVGPCENCQSDSGGSRPAPSVRAAVGEPVTTLTGVEIPVRLDGSELVGGARLDLTFPADRYRVTAVTLPRDPSSWLELHQVQGSTLRVGLVYTGNPNVIAPGPAPMEFRVRLGLLPGMDPGGEVSMAGGEFSGTDGTRLLVTMPVSSTSLGGALRMALSANHPNPFSASTRFSISLDRGADIDVAVFDVRGRSVATLFRGRAAAGAREFTWDGRSASGALAPNGIYFYRATSQERVISRKMILVRRP